MTAPATPPAQPADAIPAAPAARPDDPGRLTLAEALAELDRQPPHILAVEARHGFTFGDTGQRGPGRPVAAAACPTPGCDRQGRLVQIHDDTVQPVHCGGCSAVIHCDHAPEIRRYRDGTIGAPVEHTVTVCGVCAVELGRVSRDLPPVDLASLPVSILDQPLERS